MTGFAKIVTTVFIPFHLRTKIEDGIRNTLLGLGVPIANTRGQLHLLLDNMEEDLSELRVPIEYVGQVRDALTDTLDRWGICAVNNRVGNEIEIVRAPSEDPHKAIANYSK